MEPWFIDVPGVNLSTTLSFQFDRQGVGPSSYFLFDDPDFYPIDDQLFGNPPGEHNYLFTVEGDWIFDRDASRTEWLFVESNGDAWVYIDDRLVIDMGGIHGVTRQYVDIDRLGLTDGTTYNLKIFVAERQAGVPYQLMIATNVYLKNAGGLSVTEMAD
jgi:fibro-slime domain-containing protein